jgi:uncharacterized circularly permuted ATP-grasp superfamily protein
MFDEYEVVPGVYDEAFEGQGRTRPQYVPLFETLAKSELPALADELKGRLRKGAVTFGATDDGLMALDLVPRLITAPEWETIGAGISQRARALDNFAADVYGERAIVAAGIVPERVIESSAHYEPAMRGARPPRQWISVIGFDLVRAPDGRFLVLEDQIRMPAGIGYAVAARVALLSSGPDSAGWYEHARIARELRIPVVTLDQLERRQDGGLRAEVGGRSMALDVLYQRTDEDRFTDDEGRPTALGKLLLDPCTAGRVGCVNAPGSGVGDDKLVHAYVEEMVRFYLGEEPGLRSVETYDLGIPAGREAALDRMDELVFKPRGEMGGEGVVVWSDAGEDERAEVRRTLDEAPEGLIAQQRVQLSCHPTLCGRALRPRRVDLRPYVVRTPERDWLLAGLSRVALEEGSLIVNSSRGGGVKDTWVTD